MHERSISGLTVRIPSVKLRRQTLDLVANLDEIVKDTATRSTNAVQVEIRPLIHRPPGGYGAPTATASAELELDEMKDLAEWILERIRELDDSH